MNLPAGYCYSLSLLVAELVAASCFDPVFRLREIPLEIAVDQKGRPVDAAGRQCRREGAVESLSMALVLIGPDIRVNCCSPGMVRSEACAAVPEAVCEERYRSTGPAHRCRWVGSGLPMKSRTR